MIKDLDRLSKIISHALRHQPSLYNLELDKDGWVDVNTLISSLKVVDKKYSNLSVEDVKDMIVQSQKKRHEIKEGKIRASYGHSIKEKIIKEASKPPKYLYHGTKEEMINSIFNKGLLPMQRQYVHLSENKEDAIKVALRKTSKPILLRVRSEMAHKQGVCFYDEANSLWLSDKINPKYLERIS